MAPFVPLVNNFVKPKILELDKNMKLYLLIGATMGTDRLTLCEDLHKRFKWCLRIFALLLNITIIAMSVMYPCRETSGNIILVSCLIQYHLYAAIALIYNKDLRRFLIVLQKFDELYPETVLRKLETYNTKYFRNVLLIFVSFGHNVFSYAFPLYYLAQWTLNDALIQTLPFQFLNISESMLCTHLLQLLSERIDLVVNALEKLNENLKVPTISMTERNPSLNTCENRDIYMEKIKYSYKIIAEATDLAHSVVKWQITIMIVLQFLPTLMIWYFNVMAIVGNMDVWWVFILCSGYVSLVNLYFQTAPCLVSDQINAKVEKITASLAQLLCSADLDKKERKSTRAFLLYVEKHALRFRLLRVADVGVALPLQFITLLVTYLIIMLQFGKLINTHFHV